MPTSARYFDLVREMNNPYNHRLRLVESAKQRGMRRFRMRGLGKVATEFVLAATALNLTRLWRVAPRLRSTA